MYSIGKKESVIEWEREDGRDIVFFFSRLVRRGNTFSAARARGAHTWIFGKCMNERLPLSGWRTSCMNICSRRIGLKGVAVLREFAGRASVAARASCRFKLRATLMHRIESENRVKSFFFFFGACSELFQSISLVYALRFFIHTARCCCIQALNVSY